MLLKKKNHCNFLSSRRSIAGGRFKSTKTYEPRKPCWGVPFSPPLWKPFQVMLDPSLWFPGSDLRQGAMIYSTAPLHRTVGCITKTDLNIGTPSCTTDLVFNYTNGLLFSAKCQMYLGIHQKKQVPCAEPGLGTFHKCCSGVYKAVCVVGELFTVYLQECYRKRKQETPSLPFHWLSSLQEFPS